VRVLRYLDFFRRFGAGDEYARFVLAEKISRLIYPRYKFSEFGRMFLYDRPFIRWYESALGRSNYHSLDRKYALDQLTLLAQHLPGDTAECGVYKGASSYLICRRMSGRGKLHHAFDSFEGLSAPSPEDGTYWRAGDLSVPEAEARATLGDFDFVVFHRGWIPATFSRVADRTFCFVHLDVDLYDPTRDSLEFFYDRMVPGGIILCDDFGFRTCPGAHRAMIDFFRDKPEEIVSLPTGQGLVQTRMGTAVSEANVDA